MTSVWVVAHHGDASHCLRRALLPEGPERDKAWREALKVVTEPTASSRETA